ncbi:hypothetical protein ACNUIP_33995 [Pseudomonas aeruginosa]
MILIETGQPGAGWYWAAAQVFRRPGASGLAAGPFLVMVATSAWWSGRVAGLADWACRLRRRTDPRISRDVLEQSAAQLKTVQDTSAALFQRLAQRADSDQQTTGSFAMPGRNRC